MIHYSKFKPKILQFYVKRQYKYKTVIFEPCFADTETSHYEDLDQKGNVTKINTWVYIWAISVGKQVYYGRYLHEFFDFIDTLIDIYKIDKNHRLPIYFHNASYDISYMWSLIRDKWDAQAKGIFISPHRAICLQCSNGIDIKCSYRLVNKSLYKWTNDLDVEHKKLKDIKSYNTKFKPSDDLPEEEYKYLEHDILGLKECYTKELYLQGYSFGNVPLTSTGIVRDLFKKKYKNNNNAKYRRWFEKTKPTLEQYTRMVMSAMGGMTQGNYSILGTTVYCDDGVGHNDFDSHYPTHCLLHNYFCHPTTLQGNVTISNLLEYENEKGFGWVATVDLKDIKIKKGVTTPFLMCSKLQRTDQSITYHAVNGKITSIKGIYRTTLNHIDFKILQRQYENLNIAVVGADIYTMEPLPGYITETILELYKDKTYYKEVENHLKDIGSPKKDIEDAHLKLMLSKARLNGIFGCLYSRILRDNYQMNLDTLEFNNEETQTSIDEYYRKKGNCIPYIGSLVTSYARLELLDMVELIGYDNILYMDTDSCFYKWNQEIEEKISEYNKKCYEDSIARGLYIDYVSYDGTKKRKVLHNFEAESDSRKSKTFRTLHAKCYALEPDGKLKITVAGISAYNKDGTISREEELGSIENLKNGFVFKECGGTRADYSTIKEYDGITGGGCVIFDNIKTIHEIYANEVMYITTDREIAYS